MNEKGRRALIRLHRWRVKERRRALADLETMRAQLLAQVEALAAELVAEQGQAAASFDAHLAYAAYAEVARARRARLLSSIGEVEAALAAAQEQLAEAFRELKKHEITAAEAQQRLRRVNEQRAQQAADETALTRHRRKREQN